MLNALLAFAVKQRLMVALAVLGLLGAGVLAVLKIPIDAFPDVTNVQVQVLSSAEGMSPPEIERLVTRPIEMEMSGLPRLVEVRSVSKLGLSLVSVVFEDGVDDYFARQLVSERLQAARDKLPKSVEAGLGPISTGLGEIYQYTLESKDGRYGPMDLRTLQDYVVKPILRTIPGVTDVNSFGGLVKQYQVVPRPADLASKGITLKELCEALERNNANGTGNFIEHRSEQYVVRGLGQVKDAQEIAQIRIASRGEVPVLVRDVADVTIGAELRQGAVTKNGKGETVAGIVLMLKGASGRDVVEAVKDHLPAIRKALPPGVTLEPFYDRTDLVTSAIHTVTKALQEGAIFVLLVLLVLLADLRSAVIVTLVLPLSALFAFIMMRFFGMSANLMSLGGLAIGIGMMVDAAVVMVENIHRHLTSPIPEGMHPSKANLVLYAAKEVARPIVFAILIIVVVFLPLFTLEGFEGKMFAPLAFTIVFALLGSLLLSLTLVPMLCSLLLRQEVHKQDPFHIRWLRQGYLKALAPCMKRPWVVLLPAVLALVVAFAQLSRVGTEFLPTLDEGCVGVQTFRIPSISLTQSLAFQGKAEAILKRFPEVIDVVSKTGRADIASDPMGVEVSDVIVTLKPRSQWTTAGSKEELVEKMRAALEQLPGVASSFSQPIALRVDELVSGIKSAVGIKIFGEDLGVLKTQAEQVARLLAKIPGAADINVEKVSGLAYLDIEVDRERCARQGVEVADVQEVIEVAVGGKAVGKVYEGQKSFDLTVRFPASARKDMEAIGKIPVPSGSGKRVALENVARLRVEEGPAQISREMAQRRIVVECNVSGRDLGGFVLQAQKEIEAKIKMPTGYHVVWGGQFENQQRAMKRFGIVIPLTIGIIFLLLFGSFNSVKQALLILLNIPFALIGGIVALLLGSFNLSVSTCVGFIALFGVAVLNGVVMVSYFNELRRGGSSAREAALDGAGMRLRPVLITASVAALGLVPMLYATGPGSDIQKPLAAVVIGGLVSSTLLTLFLLPVLYAIFERGAVVAEMDPLPDPPATTEL